MSRCKVNANYSEWKTVKQIDEITYVRERISEQFKIKQTAIFKMYDGKFVRFGGFTNEDI